jgi:hypothetical protein
MKDESSKLLTFNNTWIDVAPPNFDNTWRQMWMNSSLLHEEHLESGEEWLAQGRRGSRFYIGKSLVPVGITSRD